MCDVCPIFPWWFVPVAIALLFGPFLIGAALPLLAGARRRRPLRGAALALVSLAPAGFFIADYMGLGPFAWFPSLAFAMVIFGEAPVPQIASVVFGAVGAASLLAAPPALR